MRLLRLDEIPGHLTESELFDLIGQVEHEQLEFKRGAPDAIRTTIPAMAMTDGGIIVLGVDDRKVVAGCPLTQRTLDRITRYSHDCGVEVQVREISVGDKELTLIAVPEVRGRIVTTTDGRLLRRVGGDCQPLVGDALARFVRAREERSAEDEVLPAFAPDDIDLSVVNDALRSDSRPPVRRSSLSRALVDLGVAMPPSPPLGSQVLRSAILLFGHDPSAHIPGAVVQLVRRAGVGPGPGPSSARAEYKGPIPTLLARCLQFLDDHTRNYEVVVGTRREVIPEYPKEVLREALLNALAHRDYSLAGATIDVTVWDDRIEIQSPGPLPGHITVDNMREEHYSRNRRVMRVLKLLGMVEEYGEGVDRMIGEMEARLMEPPIFGATSSSVTVTLLNRFLVSIDDQVWLALLGHYQLSRSERVALVAARQEGSVTKRRLRASLPGTDLEDLLSGAVAKGLLVRVGARGGTRYVLSDEITLRAGSHGLEAQSRKRQSLLDEIRRQGSISTAEGTALLGEDLSTVRHLLNDLVRAGLARAEGKTRARRYYEAE